VDFIQNHPDDEYNQDELWHYAIREELQKPDNQNDQVDVVLALRDAGLLRF
jgi:hypothetical protein